ncbi:hypothetical protein LOY28_16440 [Pseudomonas sp. B21-017]|uniref:hypothetical protein n=1 Tax=Pseudomonas sp. B21-017 TaxID=2895474 RepID=UPI00215EED2E|nr:hypothetical protein [Pseudomonas sp. B21-017]UVM36319.1 hypothetical protein LOY28_16440 [Pseudomonas sp. B21-017]
MLVALFYFSKAYIGDKTIDGEGISSALLITSTPEFERILSAQREGVWVEGVLLVSPGHMNGSGHWEMERLEELRESIDDRDGFQHYLYVLEGGHSYIEGAYSDLSRLRTDRVVFSIEEHLRR